ncbi:unnamed protein product [Symbiodinium pilosum]|uniref:Uncharacterized protein n=1 Tax=Symbiodinium pilosum TaxID=2952 RepID=A0A812K2D8_SYMPI|nr:unnamed protein product [Symbiodinium pilosum]
MVWRHSARFSFCGFVLLGAGLRAFVGFREHGQRGHRGFTPAAIAEQSVQADLDYVLPVGPACPLRSDTMVRGNFEKEMTMVMVVAADKAGDFATLAQQIGAGIRPDPRKQRKVGNDLRLQGERLKSLLDNMETSADFQVLEAYFVMELQAQKMGAPSARTVEKMTSWQGAGILAEAEGMMVPPPPEGVDPVALSRSAPGVGMVSQLRAPRVLPFAEDSFQGVPGTEMLEAKYTKLVEEHRELVSFGQKYAEFDQAGKEFYLDRMTDITQRWHDVLDEARSYDIRPVRGFEAYSQEYLSQSGLTPRGYRELVDGVHALLREKAG